MKPNKYVFQSLFCVALCVILSVASFAVTDTEIGASSSAVTDSADAVSRVQAAYTFDGEDLTEEVGGQYPLSTKEFGSALVESVPGYQKGGMKGYVHADRRLFDGVSQLTVAFRTAVTLAEAQDKGTLFLIHGKKNESADLQFTVAENAVLLKLTVNDGTNTSVCTYDVTGLLSESAQWLHVAFTYRVSGSVSLLTLYVNGQTVSSAVSAAFADLSAMECSTAAFHGITLDDLYYTDVALPSEKVSRLASQTADAFFAAEAEEMKNETADTPDNPDLPVEKHDYSWAAYLFDGTFAAGTDYHSGDIPAGVDQSCILIDSSKLSEKYGYALIRREASAPEAYLTLDSRLFHGQSSFTFSCWVYRNGKSSENEEYLLDLKGAGVLRFAPYYGEGEAHLEYTDVRGNLQRTSIKDGNPGDFRNKWVHYALTVSEAGEISVYVNGAVVETVASGVNPATMTYTQCRVVTGVSADHTTRTAVDEVYVTPKSLSDAEIRKIHFYGLTRYTSEVLPDPGQTDPGIDDPVNPYAPDGVDLTEDAYNQTGAVSNGFIGTTFDDRGSPGRDWNNSANATLTGGRLTQGIASYGFALDGSSFVRYPMGIFDGIDAFTISLSYFWEGAETGVARSQRIFDFSRKSSSVTDPVASIFLETGNGLSGLRFGISDGTSSTYLSCDYNAVNTWTRVTVTVSDGKITLYLNDKVAATGETRVDLSAIKPNFCYLGRSGVKGDPMFIGIIDEVYLSDQALSPQQVPLYINGISAAINGEEAKGGDLWGTILICIIVAAVVLALVIVTVIVVIIARKEKNTSEADAPTPVSITGPDEVLPTVLGPRSAKRQNSTDPMEEGDATVKFRKIDSDAAKQRPTPADTEMTAKFRRVSEESTDKNH
ncbi:MAG: LamG domain-containing protein [Clostridia bacterium]|nr:LamG domain-containing protein [Clostridia bacterium]